MLGKSIKIPSFIYSRKKMNIMTKWYQKRDFSIKVPLSFQKKLGKLQQKDAMFRIVRSVEVLPDDLADNVREELESQM